VIKLLIQPTGVISEAMPYPYYCDRDGLVKHQHIWQGQPEKCIGFAHKDDRFVIAIDFCEIESKIEDIQTSGMLPVFMNDDGTIFTLKCKCKIKLYQEKTNG
jgi:hypothetical protein